MCSANVTGKRKALLGGDGGEPPGRCADLLLRHPRWEDAAMPDGVDGEEAGFSRPERIALAVGGILTQLSLKLSEARDLLDAADRRDRAQSSRPADLQQLGRDLGRDARRRIERAAEAAASDVASDLRLAFSGGEEDLPPDPLSKKRYPPAPEHVFLFAMMGIGPTRLRQVFESVAFECGTDSDALRYVLRYIQWKHRDPLATIAGRALLPIVIADFEELLAALVRLWLTLYPDALGVNRHQLSVGDIGQYESFDDIRRLAIDAKVDDFMSRSCEGWRRQLADKLHVHVDALASNWAGVVEIFARRHAIVHAGGLVDDRYLNALVDAAAAPPVGTPLITDKDYMFAAIDQIEQLAEGLAVAWLEHFLPVGDSHLPEMASAPVLRALEQKRWHDARNLAQIALKGLGGAHPHHELRVNLWMARRELGDDWEVLRDEIEAWVPPEGEPRYLVAKAALLRDESGLLAALREYESGGFSVRDLRTWPLLIQMRERSTRIAAFVDRAAAAQTGRRPERLRRSKRR